MAIQTSPSLADIIHETSRIRFKHTKTTHHCKDAPYSVVLTKTIDTLAAPDAPIECSAELFVASVQEESATAPPSGPGDPVTTEESGGSPTTTAGRNVEDAAWSFMDYLREAETAY